MTIEFRSIPLFRHLSEEHIQAFLRIAEERRYREGEYLLRQGESGKGLLILTQGMVAVKVRTLENEERVVVHLGPGQILGEIALVDRGPHSASAVAVQPTTALYLPAEDFWDFCERHPEMGVRLLRNLAVDLAFKLRHLDLSLV